MDKVKLSIGAIIMAFIISTSALANVCDNLIGNWSGAVVDSSKKTTLIKVTITKVTSEPDSGIYHLTGTMSWGKNINVPFDQDNTYCHIFPTITTLSLRSAIDSNISLRFRSNFLEQNEIITNGPGEINTYPILLGQISK